MFKRILSLDSLGTSTPNNMGSIERSKRKAFPMREFCKEVKNISLGRYERTIATGLVEVSSNRWWKWNNRAN